MLKCILLVPAILISALPLAAREWKPFVEVGGLVEYPMEKSSPIPFDGELNHSSSGFQFELGLQHACSEFYAAFRTTAAPSREDWFVHGSQVDSVTEEWVGSSHSEKRNDLRLLLGYRWRPTEQIAGLAPQVGAGLVAGRARIRAQESGYRTIFRSVPPSGNETDWTEAPTTVVSNLLVGIQGEFGVSVPLMRGLDLLARTQVQIDYVDFDWIRTPTHTFSNLRPFLVEPSVGFHLCYTLQ